jgi:exo-1,4-beta-D-glucosaminidase
VVVSNQLHLEYKDLTLRARVLNFDLTEKFARDVKLDAAPDSVQRPLTIPALEGLSATWFLDLRLLDDAGKVLSSNFYWLSNKDDMLQWEKSTGSSTPESQFADMTQLNSLPRIALKLSGVTSATGGQGRSIGVTVENPTPQLAFMVRMRVTKRRNGAEIRPVLWSDNYFSLLPREKRTLQATFSPRDLGGDAPVVQVEGWNIVPGIAK